ncbi:hypothetical protein KPL78_04160 [Roseomonas sp. HJA6]|uniref:DUF2188 domain-containing protein n=1 Tax=Roseomonas alba TaxID=2846776 RepID=A0ABS7A413_9PROT|nr:hypothetical protein [Neoroseomonas alba]MBW6397026.1 hypothetical protein [Neoroseomonas alba]
MDQDWQRERRWIILGEDGRFVTLGRAVAPTDEDINAAEAAMRAQGVAGWVAVMSGSPWTFARPELMEVRPLASPASTFAAAVAAFRRTRLSAFDQGN